MLWLDDTPLDLAAAARWPELPGVALACSPIADHRASLFDAERASIDGATAGRQREFATGRWLARRAMAALDLPGAAVHKNHDRSPGWPEGCLGAISHDREHALALVARAGVVRGLGLDLEDAARITPELHRKLFTAGEQARLRELDPRAPGLLFAAKEAAYKAVYPLVGDFIGFPEGETELDWSGGRFRVRYRGTKAANRIMDAGEGWFGLRGQRVLALFIIR